MFTFSKGERRGILWLLPLLAVAAAIIFYANRPAFEQSFIQQVTEDARSPQPVKKPVDTPDAASAELFEFDPNTVTLQQLCKLGFTPRTAAGIIKYREKGKRFEIPEDFASCYGVSIEQYTRVEPYIRIGEQYRARPCQAFSAAAPAAKYSTDAPAGSPPAPKRLVDINSADSAVLRSVSGIGEKLVTRIIDYRARLGGYASAEQLLEIPGMYSENYERICKQITVDSCVIQKIDINFAPHENVVKALSKHPYITAEGLRKLLKNRQLKGGWRSIEDMESENIVTSSQARKLAPYLTFNPL